MSSPRVTHYVLLVASVAIVVWGALMFGAVYPWAYTPLAVASAATGVAALLVCRRGRPPIRGLALALAAVGLAIGLQLVPLPRSILVRLSPSTATFLDEYDLSYRLATTDGVEDATPAVTPRTNRPLSIVPAKTVLAAALFTALSLYLLGMVRLVSITGASRLVPSVVGFGVVLAVVGIAQHSLTAADPQPLMYGFWRPESESIPFGPFVNPNHFAGWMLMGIPLALAGFFDHLQQMVEAGAFRHVHRLSFTASRKFPGLVFYAMACFVMGLSLVMTRARSGVVAFALGALTIGTLAARRQRGRTARAAVGGLIVLLLVGVAAWAGMDTLLSKSTDTVYRGGLDPVTPRLHAWADTLRIIRDFPLSGSGLDSYGTTMITYQTSPRDRHYAEAHNDYLQLAAEGGLLVGLPVLAVSVVFVRDVRRRFREAPKVGTTYWCRIGAVVGLLAIGAQSIVEFSLQMPGNAVFFALLCAIALHQSPRLHTRSHDREAGAAVVA